MVEIGVVWGNIAQMPADVMILTTHPNGKERGDVDRAVGAVAGEAFHQQLVEHMPLRNGQLIHAKAPHGKKLVPFDSIMYVVDDLAIPLNAHVVAALAKVNSSLKPVSVTIPLLRLDSQKARRDGGFRQRAVFELVGGVKAFHKDRPRHVKKITIVAYGKQRNDMLYIQDLLKQD